MKLRAANCVKEGVTETPVKPPTQQAIDKYKERAKAFAERRKKREEKKAAETKEPAAFVMPSEWDDVPPIFMALSSDQMPKNIQEIDEDEEDEDEALSKAMAVPHDWFVLLPRYGHPEAEPSVACAAAGELPGFDTEVYECRQYEDEAGARLAAAIASAKQGPAQLGDPAEPGAGKAVATRSGPPAKQSTMTNPTAMSPEAVAGLDLGATALPSRHNVPKMAGEGGKVEGARGMHTVEGARGVHTPLPGGVKAKAAELDAPAAVDGAAGIAAPRPEARHKHVETPASGVGKLRCTLEPASSTHSHIKSRIPQGGGGDDA